MRRRKTPLRPLWTRGHHLPPESPRAERRPPCDSTGKKRTPPRRKEPPVKRTKVSGHSDNLEFKLDVLQQASISDLIKKKLIKEILGNSSSEDKRQEFIRQMLQISRYQAASVSPWPMASSLRWHWMRSLCLQPISWPGIYWGSPTVNLRIDGLSRTASRNPYRSIPAASIWHPLWDQHMSMTTLFLASIIGYPLLIWRCCWTKMPIFATRIRWWWCWPTPPRLERRWRMPWTHLSSWRQCWTTWPAPTWYAALEELLLWTRSVWTRASSHLGYLL